MAYGHYVRLILSLRKDLVLYSIENWLGYFKMSDIFILGGQKAENLKKTKWVIFCGTPCMIPFRAIFYYIVQPYMWLDYGCFCSHFGQLQISGEF